MPTVYVTNAADCPALYAATAVLKPADGTPTTQPVWVAGQTSVLITTENRKAEALDATGRVGTGGYAVRQGTGELTAGSGLTLNYSALAWAADAGQGIAAGTLALTDAAYNWVYVTQAGTVSKATSASATPPPALPSGAVFLGRVRCVAGAITEIDYSGRLEFRGSLLYRRTADTGTPADTPPASLSFFAQTTDGLYFWTGTEYRQVASAGQGMVKNHILSGETVYIPANYQMVVYRDLTIDTGGTLVIETGGELVILT